MKYIILDLEFNCIPIGWDKTRRDGLQSEIIEIGAVKLDDNFNSIAKFQTFVRPQNYFKINQIVRELTSISQNQLNQAPKFKNAFWDFMNWIRGGEYILCSWGDQDIPSLNDHCKFYNFNFYCDRFVDIQKLFQDINELEDRTSLKRAIEYYQLKENDRFHFAMNDSEYTAAILRALSTSPKFNLEISDLNRLTVRKTVLAQPNIIIPAYNKCPKCGRFTSVGERWFSERNGKRFIKYGFCKRCDIKFRITLKGGTVRKKILDSENKL